MNKKIVFLFLIFLISCKNDQKRMILGYSEFQKEMNAKFKDASKSPLTKKDLKDFKGLEFFPIDDAYKIKAVLSKTPNGAIVQFPTTTDRVAMYKEYGLLSFSIDTMVVKLTIYKEENPDLLYQDYLFLPFFDLTNGRTSYKGGRFIDVLTTDENSDGTITLDFNKAYNPSCAYSNRYSCPVPPPDNFINTEVRAGVKAYKK
mgnify:CR=1 FL=1